MLVRNNQPCMHYCGPVPFKPGVNEVSTSGAEYLITDASFKARCDAKILDVLDEKGQVVQVVAAEVVKKVAEITPKKLDAKAAITVVKETLDRSALLAMRETEKRPAVLAEIEKQLAVLNKNDEKPKDE